MTFTQYPSGLPNPSMSRVTPVERRHGSDVSGGPFQVRGIQRDYLGMQDIEWGLLSPAEAAILSAWWEDDLSDGGAWFTSTWASPQGWVSATRQFIGAPHWKLLPGGYWAVTAKVQVHGLGRTAPRSCFYEEFEHGLSPYVLLRGTLVPFSMLNRNTIRTVQTPSANDVSEIKRTIETRLLTELRLWFIVRSDDTDDAASFRVFSGGTGKVSFNPRKEAFYDPVKRAKLFMNATEYTVSSAMLTTGAWHELLVTIQDGSASTCVIRELGTATVYTTSLGTWAQPTVDGIGIYVDDADRLCETDYSHVRLC